MTTEDRSTDLAPGDFVFLAFLTRGPTSAYDIKKAMAESVSHFWAAAHSQVYQQARRLVRDGFVRERAASGPRQKRLLTLTPRGRRAVIRWLREPARPPRFFAESLVKLFFAREAGNLSATRAMLEQERAHLAERLALYESILPRLNQQQGMRYAAMTLDMGIRLHRTALAWADDTIRVLASEGR